MIEDMKYNGAYPVLADTKHPKSAGPNPIVASQKMKNVERAYERRCSGVFLVMIAVQAEFRVPKPKAAPIAQITTVTVEGYIAIKKSPMLCAKIPVTQTIKSPPLS